MENNKLPFLILLPKGQVKRYNFVITIPQHNLPAYCLKIIVISNSNNLKYLFGHCLSQLKNFDQESFDKDPKMLKDLSNKFVLFSGQNKYPSNLEEYKDLEKSKKSLKVFLEKVNISYKEEELTDYLIKIWPMFLRAFYTRFEESKLKSYGTALSANQKIPYWSEKVGFR